MSSKYEIVKSYYINGLWSEKKVRDAVLRGWITQAEYRTITGKNFSTGSK